MIKASAIASLVLAGSSVMAANKAESPEEIFTKGQFNGQAIIGYENSSTDNGTSPGYGQVNRFRLGFQTADFAGFSAFVQAQSVVHGYDEFNDTRDRKNVGDRDVIADPDGTRIHQAYLDYNNETINTKFRIGRQEIVLDDSRLLGNIGWRLNAQSFDAVRIENTSIENLTLTGIYAKRVNTINLTDNGVNHYAVAHARYQYNKTHAITAFAHMLDTKKDASGRDSITVGLRADGKGKLCEDNKFIYDLSYAQQEDYRSGQGHQGYMANGFIGAELSLITIKAGYARISGADGDNSYGFDTLYSTAHKFNGWADQFLATNGGGLVNGLEDIYIQAETKFNDNDTGIVAAFHFFDTIEDNSASTYTGAYGTELDLAITHKFEVAEGHPVKALAKYAYYNATNDSSKGTNPTTDEQVFWVRLEYNF